MSANLRFTAELIRLLCVVAALSVSGTVQAQSLEVAPVNIELPAGAMVTTLKVTNRGTEATTIQVRAFAWDQEGGIDHLSATDDLMLSPPIVEVAPGADQVIRLMLRHPAEAAEQPFRILVDQIPRPGAAGTVQLALRLSIPVFAEPATRVEPMLDWHVDSTGPALVATNKGTSHARIQSPELSTPNAPNAQMLKVAAEVNPYVLPGATRRWRIAGPVTPGTTLRFTAMEDTGRIDRTVSVGNTP
jgi:fimbrial chaperone protein